MQNTTPVVQPAKPAPTSPQIIRVKLLLRSVYGPHSLWEVIYQPDGAITFTDRKLFKSRRKFDRVYQELLDQNVVIDYMNDDGGEPRGTVFVKYNYQMRAGDMVTLMRLLRVLVHSYYPGD